MTPERTRGFEHVALLLFECQEPRTGGKKRDRRRLGHQLAQELDALIRDLDGTDVDTSKVAARPVEAGDEAIKIGRASCRERVSDTV